MGCFFFAEFSPEDADQAADTLAMYLKDAQNGELHSVNYMIDNAQHREWNAILSKNLPGFQDFLEQHNRMEALASQTTAMSEFWTISTSMLTTDL